MDLEERKQHLIRKTFLLMFRVLLIFGIPAFAAYHIGAWLDTTYDMGQKGTAIALALAFTLSWSLVIRLYVKLSKEFKALEAEEKTAEPQTEEEM